MPSRNASAIGHDLVGAADRQEIVARIDHQKAGRLGQRGAHGIEGSGARRQQRHSPVARADDGAFPQGGDHAGPDQR